MPLTHDDAICVLTARATKRAMQAILRDGDHPAFVPLLTQLAEIAYGKPAEADAPWRVDVHVYGTRQVTVVHGGIRRAARPGGYDVPSSRRSSLKDDR